MPTTAPNELSRPHAPEYPSWDCGACLQPWPCANAKTLLFGEFHEFPAVLAVYMSAQMGNAVLDLTADGSPPPPDLYDRFLAWTRLDSNKPRPDNGFREASRHTQPGYQPRPAARIANRR